MRKIKFCLVLMIGLCLSTQVLAGSLPGGFQGSLEIKYEDDRLDPDRSLVKSKFTLKRPMEIGTVNVTPYVYFEDESYEGIMSGTDRKETESAIGFDVLALSSDLAKVTLGLIYEYEYNVSGDDDALFIYKIKMDF